MDPPEGELYDVARLQTLCRAPCGTWLDTDEAHPFQVRVPGMEPSSEFNFEGLTGDVTVRFKPRNPLLYGFGMGLTVVGGVGVVGGVVITVVWAIVLGLMNLFGAMFSGLAGGSFGGVMGGTEFLYVAAIAAGAGAVVLTPGLIMLLTGGRSRLDVDAARAPATPGPIEATPAVAP